MCAMPQPVPGSRIVDRVPVCGTLEPWPSQTVRCIHSSWRGPLRMQVEGVESHLRYVALHAHRGTGRYPLHQHPYAEILLTVEGAGTVEQAGSEPISCRPGTLLVFPPRTPHAAVWAMRRDAWTLLAMDFDLALDFARLPLDAGPPVDPAFSPFYEWFFVRRKPSLHLRGAAWRQASELVKELRSCLAQADYGSGPQMLAGLLRLVVLVSRELRERGLANGRHIVPPTHSPETAMLSARTQLENRVVFDPGAIGRLARATGYSAAHFVRAFRAAFGVTPKHYAQTLLMRRACGLLQGTDLPVRGVADRLGYADASTFSRAFRRFVGTSPESFRASARHR